MDEQEYIQKVNTLMSKFVGEIHNELVDLTLEFIKTNPNRKFNDVFREPSSIFTMAYTVGWLFDRLNGIPAGEIGRSTKSLKTKMCNLLN